MKKSNKIKLKDKINERYICNEIFGINDKIDDNYLSDNMTFSYHPNTPSNYLLRACNPELKRYNQHLYSSITDPIIEHIISVENK